MSDRKPAFSGKKRPHPAAPQVTAESAATATASPIAVAPVVDKRFKHKNPDYVQLNARVPADLRRRLRVVVALDESIDLSDHVERAITAYLDALAA